MDRAQLRGISSCWVRIFLGASGALLLVMGASSRIVGDTNPVLGDILVFCALIVACYLVSGLDDDALVGMYNYVQPIVASAVGVCLGLGTFSPVKIFAVLLIFSGVWLVTISKSRSQATMKNHNGNT